MHRPFACFHPASRERKTALRMTAFAVWENRIKLSHHSMQRLSGVPRDQLGRDAFRKLSPGNL